MTVEMRVQTCRLIEQMNQNPELFRRIGAINISKYSKKENRGKGVKDEKVKGGF